MTALNTDYTFGIEIEFKGVSTTSVAEALTAADIPSRVRAYGNHDPQTFWKVTTDATVTEAGYSLSTGRGVGGELVSPILTGESGLADLNRVCDVLNSLDGLFVNVKCGVHVHLGRPDGWTASHIQSIYRRYAAFESDFDSFMPRSRRGTRGQYCGSLTHRASGVAGERSGNLSGLASSAGGRFKKLNLNPLKRVSKTIEFRQHSGSTDFDKISNWVRLLIAFSETSKTATDPASTIVSREATGVLKTSYRRRRKIAYAEIREQIAAQGWELRFAGGSVARHTCKYRLFDTEGHRRRTYFTWELDELYIEGSQRLNPETAQQFWDQWFSPLPEPVETEVQSPAVVDTIWNGVDAELEQFFYQRRLALA